MKPYRIMRVCDTCLKTGEICPDHRGMCVVCCATAKRYKIVAEGCRCGCGEKEGGGGVGPHE